MSRLALLAALSLALGLMPRAATAEPAQYCAFCHERQSVEMLRAPVEAVSGSIHGGAQNMSCADCHGGRREEPTARAHDRSAGFMARPGPDEVPDVCGGCHADAARLGADAERLPQDQLELYRRSGHGRALARGNGGVATCISCHGTHTVQPDSNADSPIHPDNIATTCGACHTDPEAMTGSGARLTQVAEWRRSVHGRAFVESDDLEAPTCNGCHDAHGGISGLNDVEACARCHPSQERSFATSPHAEVFQRLGFAGCVECHGSHDIREAHATLVGVMRESACLRCHTEGQAEIYENIRRIGERRAAAEEALLRGREALGRLRERGVVRGDGGTSPVDIQEIVTALDEAQATLSLSVHAFDEAGVEQAVRAVTDAATRAINLERSAKGDTDSEAAVWWIGLAVLVTLGAALALGLLIRSRS
jgi:hypothetical protein